MLGEPQQHDTHMKWHENLFRHWNIIIDETHAHDTTISPPFPIMKLYKKVHKANTVLPIKVYEGVEVQCNSFLTLVLERCEILWAMVATTLLS